MAQRRSFRCQACGYAGSTTEGGGFRNYLTHSPFPALCRACGAVRSVNKAEGAASGCMTCGSTEVTDFGVETRDPEQNATLIKAAERLRCRDALRTKAILRRAVRQGELTPEEAAEGEIDSASWLTASDPPWHEGDHFCPQCLTYGLRFSGVTMFLD